MEQDKKKKVENGGGEYMEEPRMQVRDLVQEAEEKFCGESLEFLVAVESSLEEDVHLATTYLEAGAPQEINVLQTTKVDLLVHLEKACQLKRAIKEDVLTLFMQNYTVFRNAWWSIYYLPSQIEGNYKKKNKKSMHFFFLDTIIQYKFLNQKKKKKFNNK